MGDPLHRLQPAFADRYAFERELGRGGMATVYLAKDLKHNRPVAVKVLRPELVAALGVERFLREVGITAQLQHPHILTLIDSGTQEGFVYYIMPYVEGESLRDRLSREKQLPIDDALQIAHEVADALTYAHGRGVIHRDIKPENILLSGGHAIVVDFGIARAISAAGGGRLTETGLSVGTPAYMSPEQATGSKQLDGRTDVYSLGCVLYELLTGDPPFTGATGQAIIARALVDAPPSLRTVRPTVSAAVEQAVARALAKVPADRFATASQFAEALIGAPARTGTERGARRQLRKAVTLASVLLLLVSAGVVAFWYLGTARGSRAASGKSATVGPQQVAVLYFQDLSKTRDLGYLADGLTDALIDTLRRVGVPGVVSKDGVARYRDSKIPRDSVARALNVGALVDGRLERIGGLLRVTIWVVDAATGVESEHRTIEASPANVFVLRDKLADAVLRLLPETPSGRASAWILVQEARRAAREAEDSNNTTVGSVGFERADSLLAKAELLDTTWIEPIYLRGWVAYRRARLSKAWQGAAPWIDSAMGHVARALDLDPGDAKSLELRGDLGYYRWLLRAPGDSVERVALLNNAEKDLRAAVRADSSLASAWNTLSHLYYQVEDVPAAILAAQQAEKADPNFRLIGDLFYRLFIGSLDLEQFSQAERWCNEETRRSPRDYRSAQCRLLLMATPVRSPDVEEAWHLVAILDTVAPKEYRAYLRLESRLRAGGVIARAGLKDSARHVLDRARAATTHAADPGHELLAIEAYERTLLGDRDEAIALLRRYAAANPSSHFEPGRDISWWWRDLKDDPRFKALIGTER